jgi:Spy/CpxP family protein refolding chaperone
MIVTKTKLIIISALEIVVRLLPLPDLPLGANPVLRSCSDGLFESIGHPSACNRRMATEFEVPPARVQIGYINRRSEKMSAKTIACLLICSQLAFAAETRTLSPYADQRDRAIKALSPEEIDGYLQGKGMGLARAAELNGYPGPRHVLDLADQLGLTDAQRQATDAVFAAMQAEARQKGRELVEQERSLDQLFAERAVSPESLRKSLDRIGVLQGQLRAAHLQAHLQEAAILSAEQNAHYEVLRGYGAAGVPMQHAAGHDH